MVDQLDEEVSAVTPDRKVALALQKLAVARRLIAEAEKDIQAVRKPKGSGAAHTQRAVVLDKHETGGVDC